MGTVFPQFEVYPWLPRGLIRWYKRILPHIEKLPVVRRFGLSILIVGQKL
jgi:hypothetical protein